MGIKKHGPQSICLEAVELARTQRKKETHADTWALPLIPCAVKCSTFQDRIQAKA